MATTEQKTRETSKVMNAMEGKLGGITILAGAIIDLCHYYRESDYVNQENPFINIINLAERINTDATATLEELEIVQDSANQPTQQI